MQVIESLLRLKQVNSLYRWEADDRSRYFYLPAWYGSACRYAMMIHTGFELKQRVWHHTRLLYMSISIQQEGVPL